MKIEDFKSKVLGLETFRDDLRIIENSKNLVSDISYKFKEVYRSDLNYPRDHGLLEVRFIITKKKAIPEFFPQEVFMDKTDEFVFEYLRDPKTGEWKPYKIIKQ